MRDDGHRMGFLHRVIKAACQVGSSTDPHRSTIAVAAVWLGVVVKHPLKEALPSASFAPLPLTPVLQRSHWVEVVQDGMCNRDRANRVAGKFRPRMKARLEILCAVVIELVDRPDNIARNCAKHLFPAS